MVLIGLLAKKGHGKDTVADYLVKKYGFNKLVLADPVKDICRILFDFNDRQLYGDLKEVKDSFWGVTPRRIFQYIGTDIFRKDISKIIPNIKNNFWIEHMKNKYIKLIKKDPEIMCVVSDLRFQNEVNTIKELNGIIIKINRPGIKNTDYHESEAGIDKIKEYNYVVNNSSTLENLYSKVDDIIKNL